MKLKTAKDLQGWHNTYPSNHPTRDLIERIDDKETALAEAQRERHHFKFVVEQFMAAMGGDTKGIPP